MLPSLASITGAIVAAGLPLIAAAAPVDALCDRSQFRVVLDVGHSVEATGATSARGVPEYQFNLQLADTIREAASKAGYPAAQVMVTRGEARESLTRRVARANAIAPDLVVSVHHDSVQEIYLQTWQHDDKPHRHSDRFHGYSIFVSRQNKFPDDSMRFAKALGDELKARDLAFSTHHAENIKGERREFLDPARGIFAFDALIVLRGIMAPAVLFEAGLIVNRDEEVMLTSPQRRSAIADAFVAALNRYCPHKDAAAPPQQKAP